MAAERVLTGHMDADKPIWAVVENVTVKLAGCIVYDINKSWQYICAEESQRTTVFLVKKRYIDTTSIITKLSTVYKRKDCRVYI